MAFRPYQPGRSRISRMIRRRELLLGLRGAGAVALADQLDSLGRALDAGPQAPRAGAAPANDAATPEEPTPEPWWER